MGLRLNLKFESIYLDDLRIVNKNIDFIAATKYKYLFSNEVWMGTFMIRILMHGTVLCGVLVFTVQSYKPVKV